MTVTEGTRAVEQAQVAIVGTTIGGLTGADGKATLRAVPAGVQTVRVLRVGYGEQKRTVTVENGRTVAVDVALSAVAVNLTPVVTTATGETRRVEIGNAVASIDVTRLKENSPVTNMNDLLNARTPGVLVTPSTQTGSGSRIRIRGTSSLSLTNDPIYVIDGVRMTGGTNTSLFTGDAQAGRVGDINPEDIENIEIVKGPSAATLYGTDAANGVVVITTKKGRAGQARWNVYEENGELTDRNPYPWNYTIAGHSPGLTAYRECGLPLISAGTCVKDSVRQYSPLHDPNATPLGMGHRTELGAQVSGGTDALRYFVAFSRQVETGVFKLPNFEYAMLDSSALPIRKWMAHPNQLDQSSVRANLSVAVNPKLDITVSTGITMGDTYLLQASNATAGLGSQAFGGPGYPGNGTVATVNTLLHGYRAWTPAYTYQEKVEQAINRFIASANVNYRPTSWLQVRADVGNDLTDRVEQNLLFRGEGPPLTSTYRQGFANDYRFNDRNFTANLSATATNSFGSSYILKSTVGLQYVDYLRDGDGAQGSVLAPGTQTPPAGTIISVTNTYVPQRTLGQFLEEQLAIRDRLFLTVAVRTDQNSAFGTNFQNILYPKASASWIISDEPWFKVPSFLRIDNLRLRAAYGSSGVQPGPLDALRTFGATTTNVRGTDQPGVIFSALGNSDLKPEQTTETEVGFEARMFKGLLNLDATYYAKKTKDALISAIVAPSAGAAPSVRRNLGSVSNSGWEAVINTQLVDRKSLGIDVTLNMSINDNKLVSLGNTPPQIGVTTRAVEGYPLFGLWAKHITGWQDKNGDGILTYNKDPNLNEVFVDTAVTFRAYSAPRKTLAMTTGVELLDRKLRLTALLDYRGGDLYYNNTERIRCVSRQNCNGLMNPGASFEEQAMVVATRNDPSATLDGFFQPGGFLKLREISAVYTLPDRLARSVRARSATVMLSARNLAKWTNYRGVDPENDYTATAGGDNPSDFQSFGAPTYYILRFTLGF
ncbi:MAG: SusC/RagA family TonB-linked outer membrane protein [Gemmatimonadetes bacterium]|nr:SusC/RagA family TonB-linked outer membrane protein [Gemmatimonadota bacterium]MBI3567137.1 SusC/RagA family TonB-linked outer membrane protein [Gemmatimonadota bacterium]